MASSSLSRSPMPPTTTAAPYWDASLSIEERVDDLLTRMTVPEKVGQLLQLDATGDLQDIVLTRCAGSILHASPEQMSEAVALTSRTRLGIPLLTAEDCIHGHSFWPGATIFPTQLGMAATWDADLLEACARVTAVEAAATGIHWVFSPVLCITRDLRWGRVDETFGEDPFLISELGAAMIRGYQGEGLDDPTAVLACAKHFAGYSETQGGRDASEADISRRKLRSWFLPPFEHAVQQGCRTFMLGYQALDGVPITANSWLLDDVLKKEWGFSGTLVTDFDNVGRMVWEQKVCADDAEAAAVAVRAGNDMVMATPSFFEGAQEALAKGLISEEDIDRAVRRILRLKFELGLFENPRLPDPARQAEVIGCADHSDLNLQIARRSLVLLRNDGTLPLDGRPGAGTAVSALADGGTDAEADAVDPSPVKNASAGTTPRSLLVVGPNADDPHAQLGDWAGASGQLDWMGDGHPRDTVETVLDGLRAVVPTDWTVTHHRGAEIGVLKPNPAGSVFPDGQPRYPVLEPAAPDPGMIAEAVDAAQRADYVIAVVGDNVSLIGEGRSTATLELLGGQVALLEALAETGTPIIVVLLNSKPAVLPPAALTAAALIQAFNPGMRGGRAIAELILGRIEPSGRLPVSFARHVGQQPVYYNGVRGQHGDRYADLTQDPLFAFGEGLSYSTVEYTDLVVHTPQVAPDETVHAEVKLTNTGARPALETVQVYVSDLVTTVTWAERELKSYKQVNLEPGESVTVDLGLPAASCTLVTADCRRTVEPGEFALFVGPSSRTTDLLNASFRIA
jgi:beta-glucosidase